TPGTQVSSRSGSVGPASNGLPQAPPGAATNRPGEQTDQIDVSWLSRAERVALRRELNRLRASKAVSPSSAPVEARTLEGSCGLIAPAGAARTSRGGEVRYRVDPNIWDLPQFASIPYDQLVSDYLG